MGIDRQAILAERLQRQGLAEPVRTPEEYAALFRLLQPVSPLYFSYPGSPPSLVHRSEFSDWDITSDWRGTREIVKGRFLGGTIGYVFSTELTLYANAFQRRIARLSRVQERVLETLTHVGPLTPRQLKEETGLLNKEVMPVLHRLQEAFLVYEDQIETDWERAWYEFSQEWPDVDIDPDAWEAAAREVLGRFIRANVFATAEQIRDWSGWPVRGIARLLPSLEAEGTVTACTVASLGDGWMRTEDTCLAPAEPTKSVFMLHRADPLVRASMSELKRRFAGLEVLQYLLIDGEFRGAVCGHWRIGPHDVDDIITDLPPRDRAARRDAIIAAVAGQYHPPSHNILAYGGEPL